MMYKIEQISPDLAQQLCREITADLPEYFGLAEANERYFQGVSSRISLGAKIDDKYVGLITVDFSYKSSANLYWIAVLRDYQAHGIGHDLIKGASKLATEKGATTLTVETLSPNEADEKYLKTYQFYKSCGFTPLFNLKPEGYKWNMVYMLKTLERTNPPLGDTDITLKTVLEELIAREPIFHHPELGTSRVDLENMTDPAFWEVGASGNRYSREYVIETLLERYQDWPESEALEIQGPHCLEIAPNNYLLTYTLIQDHKRITRRSTIWRKTNTGWKILYHQGTIAEE